MNASMPKIASKYSAEWCVCIYSQPNYGYKIYYLS